MKRFNFTPIQKHDLAEMMRDCATDIINVKFEDTDADTASIRRRVYLQGRLDVLTELHRDDFPQPELNEPEN